MRGSGLFGFG
jgi:hypothetical protein